MIREAEVWFWKFQGYPQHAYIKRKKQRSESCGEMSAFSDWLLQQWEANERQRGWDMETEEVLEAGNCLEHQRTSNLRFCQHIWLAASWVKHHLYTNPKLNKELSSTLRTSGSESLAQWNCWAWGQAAVECQCCNKSLSTPWKKTQSPQLFSLLWPMATKTPYHN